MRVERIERKLEMAPVPSLNGPSPPLRSRLSSVQSMASASSFAWNLFAFVKRKICNFFRAILSYILPVQSREKIKPEEISLSKIKGKELTYQICLNGFRTNNIVGFKKEKDALVLLDLKISDPEMHGHIGMILDQVMRKEHAGSIAVNDLHKAQFLRKWGFGTKDKICYNLEDKKGEKNNEIRRVIAKAREKEPILDNYHRSALQRVERQLEETNFFGSMLGSFVQIDNTCRDLSVTDVLILTELNEVGALTQAAIEEGPIHFNKGTVFTEVGEFDVVEEEKL